MESRYGIGINNRYALFLEGEDGEDLIVPKKKTSDTKAPVIDAKPAAPAVKKADNMDSKKDKTNNQNNRVTKDNKANNREGMEKTLDHCAQAVELLLNLHKKVNACLVSMRHSCYTCDRVYK